MNTDKKISQDKEIDLKEFKVLLIREKLFILIIALSFTIAFYIYSAYQLKFYQTTINISDASFSDFEPYTKYFPEKKNNQYVKVFNNDFKTKLLSFDHLMAFVKQYNKINEFKSYLKKKNINIEDYFRNKPNKVVSIKKNKEKNLYALNFSKPLPGQEFLNDYIIYTKKIAETKITETLLRDTQDLILIYNKHLEIAKKIDLDFPRPGTKPELNKLDNLFNKGTKVLTHEIQIIEHSIDQLQKLSLKYNPIVDKASKPIQISKSTHFFILFGFANGLFLAVFIIFIKNTLRRKEALKLLSKIKKI